MLRYSKGDQSIFRVSIKDISYIIREEQAGNKLNAKLSVQCA